MKSEKFILFELLKIILAFLVINLHIESFVLSKQFSLVYYIGWYSVPLFVTMNYYFNSNKFMTSQFDLTKFKKIIQRLLMPLIFWSVVGFILHPDLITTKYLLRQIITGTAVNPPLYFLTTMIYVSIIIFVFKKYILNNPKLAIMLVFIFVFFENSGIEMLIASKLWIQIELAVIRIFELFKYALLGLYLPAIYDCLKKNINLKYLYYLTILFLFMDIGSEYYFKPSHMNYGGIMQFTTVALIMISIIHLSFSNMFTNYKTIILSISKYTLGIFCIHTFIIERISWQINGLVLSGIIFIASYLIASIIDRMSLGKLRPVIS